MSGSFEKSVKGGTKIKLAAPKSKYVEHILVATHAGDAGVAEIFRALQNRLRDSTWTIVFKALIIIHLMVREGEPNVTLKYIADQPSKLAISQFSDVQVQGTNIRHYHTYILIRAKAFRDTRLDWVREGRGRLKRQTVDKGLLRETEAVQSQIQALVKCDLLSSDVENEITLTAFRLLTMDLLALFHIMNEGTINVLEHYFEMSKFDAERALGIYKTFSKQTNQVVEFLSTARQYEDSTRLEIPKLKHAPTSLTSSLEEYLNDPDFEINRRQYLAQQEAKKGRKVTSNGIPDASTASAAKKSALSKIEINKSFPEPRLAQAAASKPEPKGPAPDLIDFFDSIEQNQTPMANQPQQQTQNFQQAPYQQQQLQAQQPGFFAQPGLQQQQTSAFGNSNPFGQSIQQQQPTQQNLPGTGFGGFGQQSFDQQQAHVDPAQNAAQNGVSQFNPQQAFTQMQTQTQPQSPTNGFTQQQQTFNTGHQPQPQSQQQPQQQQQSSNPFRQSMFSQNTGMSNGSFPSNSSVNSPVAQQSTNPFARNTTGQGPNHNSPFQSPPPSQPFVPQQPYAFSPPAEPQAFPPSQPQQSAPLQPMRTGTNPFARNISPPQSQQLTPAPLVPTQTGSTNPFRQSVFANQQAGQGWQASQGTMGGLEHLPTIPVFPRPGQQQPQQPQPWS